jgi:uncharacterized protein
MAQKKETIRRKHIPTRTCIVCRRSLPKRELVRVVRAPSGDVGVDLTGKKPGRGAYLCQRRACWIEAIKKKSLDHALKATLTEEEKARLAGYADSLTTGDTEGQAGVRDKGSDAMNA